MTRSLLLALAAVFVAIATPLPVASQTPPQMAAAVVPAPATPTTASGCT